MGQGGNLIVGLTGGMGSGKSTAAALFAGLGFVRLDADQVVRDVLWRDPEVLSQARARWGGGIIGPDGSIDRTRVGEVVFGDEMELAWLEDLLHPRLHAHWEQVYAGARDTRFIVEVPLLFEKQLQNRFDYTVCVATESASQIRRLEQRGVPPGTAHQRLAKQLPLARKCELADFVLLNDGSLEFLREQVGLLASHLISLPKS